MKLKLYISLLLAFCATTFAFSQPPGPGPDGPRERIEAMKVGFLTNRLDLSPEEAKEFWPLYNKYQDELEQLRKSRRENLMNARQNFDQMSDADVEKLIDNELNFRQSELDIIKKYNPQFRKVLPVKKVARLYKAEEDFKQRLLEQLQERREERRNNGDGMRNNR